MIINHTVDSPILIRLIPETPKEIIDNAKRSVSLDSKHCKLKDSGILLINVDENWHDFKEHDLNSDKCLAPDY